ncbi:hypothetical protein AVEN_219910-1 [Araneus ventricosus]|uniref:Tc1-like transposase DDE domain-containing protein n=1 Tax=Araneus ventricosus TaxID=182803 RepID=A0A4Y2PKB3_ARAVE|nr:hypothetical protein AVEN_219910-1 [Araneus ventricosus]
MSLVKEGRHVATPPRGTEVSATPLLEQKFGLLKTINAAVFRQPLRRLRRAILTSGVVLIHDNSRFYNGIITQQILGQFKWGVCDHPTYSPDLAMSDFHLFSELKNWLGD